MSVLLCDRCFCSDRGINLGNLPVSILILESVTHHNFRTRISRILCSLPSLKRNIHFEERLILLWPRSWNAFAWFLPSPVEYFATWWVTWHRKLHQELELYSRSPNPVLMIAVLPSLDISFVWCWSIIISTSFWKWRLICIFAFRFQPNLSVQTHWTCFTYDALAALFITKEIS